LPRSTGDPGAPLLDEVLEPPAPDELLLVLLAVPPPAPDELLVLLAPPAPLEVLPEVAGLSLVDEPQAAASVANRRHEMEWARLIRSFDARHPRTWASRIGLDGA
jgi:hypothetical protein